MFIIKNYNSIANSVQSLSKKTTLIVVTKNQQLDKINLLNTFTALEIVEYNPSLDKDFLTFNLIKDIINLCNKPPI